MEGPAVRNAKCEMRNAKIRDPGSGNRDPGLTTFHTFHTFLTFLTLQYDREPVMERGNR
jgi:hypothetical protein